MTLSTVDASGDSTSTFGNNVGDTDHCRYENNTDISGDACQFW